MTYHYRHFLRFSSWVISGWLSVSSYSSSLPVSTRHRCCYTSHMTRPHATRLHTAQHYRGWNVIPRYTCFLRLEKIRLPLRHIRRSYITFINTINGDSYTNFFISRFCHYCICRETYFTLLLHSRRYIVITPSLLCHWSFINSHLVSSAIILHIIFSFGFLFHFLVISIIFSFLHNYIIILIALINNEYTPRIQYKILYDDEYDYTSCYRQHDNTLFHTSAYTVTFTYHDIRNICITAIVSYIHILVISFVSEPSLAYSLHWSHESFSFNALRHRLSSSRLSFVIYLISLVYHHFSFLHYIQ